MRRLHSQFDGPADPRLAGQVGQAQAALAGQRVVRAEHEVHGVLEQVEVLEAVALAVLGRAAAEGEGQVDVAHAHGGQRLLGLHQRHGELDGRMRLGEAGDGQRHHGRRRRLEGGEAQAAPAQARDVLELGLGLGEPAEDRLRVAHERLARLREPHAAGAALDQHGAGLALERGDLLGHGGLREGERLGGGRERAAQGDLPEHAHAADVEHQSNL